jgi:hypothetical protein
MWTKTTGPDGKPRMEWVSATVISSGFPSLEALRVQKELQDAIRKKEEEEKRRRALNR